MQAQKVAGTTASVAINKDRPPTKNALPNAPPTSCLRAGGSEFCADGNDEPITSPKILETLSGRYFLSLESPKGICRHRPRTYTPQHGRSTHDREATTLVSHANAHLVQTRRGDRGSDTNADVLRVIDCDDDSPRHAVNYGDKCSDAESDAGPVDLTEERGPDPRKREGPRVARDAGAHGKSRQRSFFYRITATIRRGGERPRYWHRAITAREGASKPIKSVPARTSTTIRLRRGEARGRLVEYLMDVQVTTSWESCVKLRWLGRAALLHMGCRGAGSTAHGGVTRKELRALGRTWIFQGQHSLLV